MLLTPSSRLRLKLHISVALVISLGLGCTAAPVQESTEIQHYSEGCYYNYNYYNEGDRILTNEPCLNCTCHNKMLMCYLRVCPFTKPIGHDCTIEKREDQCCPIITCPEVPVELEDNQEPGTHLAMPRKHGCTVNDKYYPEGAQVPSSPSKPCELCYCIHNRTSCIMQECTLHVNGCQPIYHRNVCCPVRYNCDHDEENELVFEDEMTTTVRPTPGFILTTTLMPKESSECDHNGTIYADGESIKSDQACEHCYCMRGDIVCAVQECKLPLEKQGANCTALPANEGDCCPSTYVCSDSDENEIIESTEAIFKPEVKITTELPFTVGEQTTIETPNLGQDIHEGISEEDVQLQEHIDDKSEEEQKLDETDESNLLKIGADTQEAEESKTTPPVTDTTKRPFEEHLATISPEAEISLEQTTKKPEEDEISHFEGITTPTISPSEESTTPGIIEDITQRETISSEDKKIPDLIHPDRKTTLGRIQPEEQTTPSIISPEEKTTAPSIISPEEKTTTPSIISPEEKTTPAIIPSEESITPIETITESIPHLFDVEKDSYTTAIPKESTANLQDRFEQTTPEITSYTQVPDFEDNEIVPISIPGEGDCLIDKTTYKNNTSVPPANACDTSCICLSSVVICTKMKCEEPSSPDCRIVESELDLCCPTYNCESKIDEDELYQQMTTKKYKDISLEDTDELTTPLTTTGPESSTEGDKMLLIGVEPDQKEDHVEMVTEHEVAQEFQPESLMTVSPQIVEKEEEVTTAAPHAQDDETKDIESTELRIDAKKPEHTTEQPVVPDKHVPDEQTISGTVAPQKEDIDINIISPTEPKQPSHEVEDSHKPDQIEQEMKTLTTASPLSTEEGFTTTEKLESADIEGHPVTEREGVVEQTISPAEQGTYTEGEQPKPVAEEFAEEEEPKTATEESPVEAQTKPIPAEPSEEAEHEPATEKSPVEAQTKTSAIEPFEEAKLKPSTEKSPVEAQTKPADEELQPAAEDYPEEAQPKPTTEESPVEAQTKRTGEGPSEESQPAAEEYPEEAKPKPTTEESPVEAQTKRTGEEPSEESQPAVEEYPEEAKPKPTTEEAPVETQTKRTGEEPSEESQPAAEEYPEEAQPKPTTEESPVEAQTKRTGEEPSEESQPAAEEYPEEAQPKPTTEGSPVEAQTKRTGEEPSEESQPAAEEYPEEAQPIPTTEESPVEVQTKRTGEKPSEELQPAVEEYPEEAQPKPTTEESPVEAQTKPAGEEISEELQPAAEEYPEEAQPKPSTEESPVEAQTKRIDEAPSEGSQPAAEEYPEETQPKPTTEESPVEAQTKRTDEEPSAESQPVGEESPEEPQPTPISEQSPMESTTKPTAEESPIEAQTRPTGEESSEEAHPKPISEESLEEQDHGESMHVPTESSTPSGQYYTEKPVEELHKDMHIPAEAGYTSTPSAPVEKETQTEGIISDDTQIGTESAAIPSQGTEEPATAIPLYPLDEEKEVDIKVHELEDHDEFLPSEDTTDTAAKMGVITDAPETPSRFDGKPTEAPLQVEDSTLEVSGDKITTLWDGLIPSSTKGTPTKDSFGDVEPESDHELEAQQEPEAEHKPSIDATPKTEVDTTEESVEATISPDSKLSSKDFSRKEESTVTTESSIEMKPFEVTGYPISEQPEIPFVGDLIKENETEADIEHEKAETPEETAEEESLRKVTTEAAISDTTEGISGVPERPDDKIDDAKDTWQSRTTSEPTTISEQAFEKEMGVQVMQHSSSTTEPTTEPSQMGEISQGTTPEQLKIETSPTDIISEIGETTQPSIHLMQPSSTPKLERDQLTTESIDLITHPPQDKYTTESAEVSTSGIKKEDENITYQPMEVTTLMPSSDVRTTSKLNLTFEDMEQTTKDRTYQTTEGIDIFQETSSEPTRGVTDLFDRFGEDALNRSTPTTILEGVKTTTPSLLDILSTEVPQTILHETRAPMVEDKIGTEHPPELPSSTATAEPLDGGDKVESLPKATEKPINATAENDIEKPDSNRIPTQGPKQPTYGQLPPQYPSYSEDDYTEEDEGEVFGPGTCRYGGKLFVSAQQIPRDDPCDFCFCFRSDIICLQQSCPPPISGCHEEPIHGFCCPRYECPVSMGLDLNSTTTTTTSTTLPPHFLHHAYRGLPAKNGCHIQGKSYKIGDKIDSASGPCMHCSCGGDGQMKCEPKTCTPEPMLRQMIAVVASRRR